MFQNAFDAIRLHSDIFLDFRSSLLVIGVAFFLRRLIQRQRENEAGKRQGCEPMKSKYLCQWPLGLDVLYAQYKALVENRLLAFQQSYLDDLGPNLEIQILGSKGYTTLDPQNVEAILSSRFEDYCLGSRRGALFPFIGEGIFTQDGGPWKHSRELLRRPFLKTHYQDLKGFAKPFENLVGLLSLSSPSTVVDLQPLFFRFTLATTTALIFGQPLESFDDLDKHDFASSFDYASMISSLRTRLMDFHWIYHPSRYRTACRNVKAYADGFVKRALRDQIKLPTKENPDSYTFVEDLCSEIQDAELIRDQLVNILLAGRDTTACLLSWTFFLLVRHPKVLCRLREEIRSVLCNDLEITRLHIQKIAYLKCILNETLRLYPPIPINVRFARETTWLPRGGGSDGSSPVLVRRGMGVGFPVYYMHRRRDIYGEDAMEFRPERWEGSELTDIGWAYLPFHGGSRVCLGKDFALMEASYVIIRLLQVFPNIRLPMDYPIVPTGQEKQELTVFLRSADGCKVLLR